MALISARCLGALLMSIHACKLITTIAAHPARIASHASSIASRDASTLMSGGRNNEGADHGALSVPDGANLTSLPVGTGGEQVAVYWSERSNNQRATQALVSIHGRIRNGNQYWQILEHALTNAVRDEYPGASNDSIVVAPQFFSTRFNSGQYNRSHLAWADVNAWQAGEIATHPRDTNSSAFDVLDAFVLEFGNRTKYPAMRNVTVVGHGGGAQLIQRYAVVGRTPPSLDVYTRYVYGDPSSSLYFTSDRPTVDTHVANKTTCPWYDTWRYGFNNFTANVMPSGGKPPLEYFAQYVKRDVVSLIGYQDTDVSGDQYCMALLQGGQERRNRNLAYWKYINLLARTNFDLTGFNASFDTTLPDWSNVTNHEINHRLIIIKQADHDPNAVFGSDEGRAALFSSGELPTGWRPQGWNPNGTGRYSTGHANYSSAAGSRAKGGSSSSSSGTLRTTVPPFIAILCLGCTFSLVCL